MASKPLWRHDRQGWLQQVQQWVDAPRPESLLNVDIFYDLQPVWGDRSLAEDLRNAALQAASRSVVFLKALSMKLEGFTPPIGMFGRFRTDQGMVDLKIGGLFPIVAGARTLALRYRIAATGTAERLAAVHALGHLNTGDLNALTIAHQTILGAMLRQQIADIAAGLEPGNKVDVRRLDRPTRSVLASMVKRLQFAPQMVRGALMD